MLASLAYHREDVSGKSQAGAPLPRSFAAMYRSTPIYAPAGSYGPDNFAASVGTATHRVIAQMLEAASSASREELDDLLWELSAAAVQVPSLSRRRRAARIAVAGHAAVYFERFLPAPRWVCLGAEVDLGLGLRADLGFEGVGGVFLDEIKLADSRMALRSAASTGLQVAAYAARGGVLFGSRFLGVRLLYLAAPNRSVLVHADGRRLPLADSPLSDVADTPDR